MHHEIITTPEGPIGTDPIEHQRREKRNLLVVHPTRRFPEKPRFRLHLAQKR